LRELQLGDVVNERDRALRRARRVPDEGPRDPDPERGPVLAQVALLVDARLRRRQKLLVEIVRRLPVIGVGDLLAAPVEKFLGFVTEHAAERFVDAQEPALGRSHGHTDRVLFEKRSEQRFAVRNDDSALTILPAYPLSSPPRRRVAPRRAPLVEL